MIDRENLKAEIRQWIAGKDVPVWPFEGLERFRMEWRELLTGEGIEDGGVQTFGECLLCSGILADEGIVFTALVDPNGGGVQLRIRMDSGREE